MRQASHNASDTADLLGATPINYDDNNDDDYYFYNRCSGNSRTAQGVGWRSQTLRRRRLLTTPTKPLMRLVH